MKKTLKSPQVQILPKAQLDLWVRLNEIPKEFVLYGWTAIALYLGHRQSVDFDFFSFGSIDPDQILLDLPFLAGASVLQKEKNTLTCLVDFDEPVKISFFGLPKLSALFEPLRIQENSLQIASLVDLGGTKCATVQNRAEYKDYFDISKILSVAKIPLIDILSAAKLIYGPTFNHQITLKALSYFDDGDLNNLVL